MGLFDKVKNKLVGDENFGDNYDENYFEGDNDIYGTSSYDEVQDENVAEEETEAATSGTTSNFGINSGVSLNGSAIELKVVKPDRFENVSQIADHLLQNRTVVLNLESTNKETARRLIDFLSGVAYSINGQLKRVANNAYVITPNNVDISGDQMRAKAAQADEANGESAAN